MRRWRIALAAGLLAAGLPAMAQALIYTFVATPLIVAVGDVTDYTFTFTNLGPGSPGVRCVEVLFPDELWISGVGTPVASNGRPWSAGLQGQWVLAVGSGGGARLRSGESVTFTVTALATSAGAFTFENHTHSTTACDDANNEGIPALVTVLPAATPTPSPTPTPTPKPTPVPTPKPTPDPTARPTPEPTPEVTASPTPSATPTREASATERPSAPPPSASPSTSGGVPPVRVAPFDDGANGVTNDLGVGVDVLGLLDNPFEWFVPGAPVALPGLLVILFVLLQAVGALAWIPAVRRMGDDDDDRHRRERRRPTTPGA